MKKKILISIIVVVTGVIGIGGYSIIKFNKQTPQVATRAVGTKEIITPVKVIITPKPILEKEKVVEETSPKKAEGIKNSTSSKKSEVKDEVVKVSESKKEPVHHEEIAVVKHTEGKQPVKEIEHKAEVHSLQNSNEPKKEVTHIEKSKPKKDIVSHQNESNEDKSEKTEMKSKSIYHSGDYIEGIGTSEDAIRIVKHYFGKFAKDHIFLTPQNMGNKRYYVPVKMPGDADINAMGYIVNPINSGEPRVQEVG